MGRILFNKQQALVVSSGGAGTTLLIEFISRHLAVNHAYDKDGLKHLTIPPVCLNPDIKILYIHGDPVGAVASLFRRGYHHSQSRKLQRHMPGTKRWIPFGMSLDEYAAEGVDRLFMHEHFTNWHDKFRLNDTLFVRFEAMWEHLDEIFDFLGLPKEEQVSFPAKGERRSSISDLKEQTREALQVMHAPLIESLAALPDIHLVHGTRVPLWRHGLLLTRQGRCAAVGQLLHLLRRLRLAGKATRRSLLKPFGYKPTAKKDKGDDVL